MNTYLNVKGEIGFNALSSLGQNGIDFIVAFMFYRKKSGQSGHLQTAMSSRIKMKDMSLKSILKDLRKCLYYFVNKFLGFQ